MRAHVFASTWAICAMLGRSAEAEDNWATTRAREQVHQGRRAMERGDAEQGARRFLAALEVDPTYGDAYLALATLRTAQGDVDEALRIYAVALEHVAGFVEGLVARSSLHRRLGQHSEAIADLLLALRQRPDDLAILGELVETAIQARELPRALAFARKRKALATAAGDTITYRDARITEIALVRLLDETDPVMARRSEGGVRGMLANQASRMMPQKKR